MHTAKALQLPLDPQIHTRIVCDYCRHPILGIGRTSTQTTLASIETTGPSAQFQPLEADPETAPQQQPSNAPTFPAPLRVNTSLISAQLSTIAEANSPAQQSSAALVSSSPDGLGSERSASHDRINHSQSRGGQERETTQSENTQLRSLAPQKTPTRFLGTLSASQSKRSLRSKISAHFQKSRKFTIHRLGIHIEVSLTAKIPSPHSSPTTTIRQRRSNHEDYVPPSSAVATPHSKNEDSLDGGHSVLAPAEEQSQAPSSSHPDRLIGRIPTQHDKDERIRVRRRDATLKRKAEMMATCECRSECQCRNGSVYSNAASYGPGDSDRSIQIPEHVLQNLFDEGSGSSTSRSSSSMARALNLAGIDGHVHFEHASPELDDPADTALESRPSLDERMSQASTAYVRSNGSSISLASRRPSPLRRSNTAPGFTTRRPTHGFRPGVLEALQHRYIPDQVNGPSSESPNPPRNGDRNSGATSAQTLGIGAEVLDDLVGLGT